MRKHRRGLTSFIYSSMLYILKTIPTIDECLDTRSLRKKREVALLCKDTILAQRFLQHLFVSNPWAFSKQTWNSRALFFLAKGGTAWTQKWFATGAPAHVKTENEPKTAGFLGSELALMHYIMLVWKMSTMKISLLHSAAAVFPAYW